MFARLTLAHGTILGPPMSCTQRVEGPKLDPSAVSSYSSTQVLGPVLPPPMNRTLYFFNSSAWARPHSAYEPYWVNRKNET